MKDQQAYLLLRKADAKVTRNAHFAYSHVGAVFMPNATAVLDADEIRKGAVTYRCHRLMDPQEHAKETRRK